MFRDSDMKDRRMHSSYTNKPVVPMQRISQANRLDDSGLSNRTWQTSDAPEQPAVPTTWDTVYEPNHPDADWSGYVNIKEHCTRRHATNPAAHRVGIEAGNSGYLVGKEDKSDFAQRKQPLGGAKNSSSIIIGGIDEAEGRFTTTYDRFATREPTKRDQLTLVKRDSAVRKINDPAQARSSHQQMNALLSAQREQQDYEEYLYSNRNRPHGQEAGGSSQVAGFRGASMANKSLLGNIGELLVSNNPDLKPPSRVSAPIPDSTTNRLLVTENYQPYPGYTGRKK